MQRPARIRSGRPPKAEKQPSLSARRDFFAALIGVATIICLALAFVLANGTRFLMPGPLASAHGAIEDCGACHTKSGDGKLSWLHGLVAGDPLADSKACLTCHKIPDTPFNSHSASAEVLEVSTRRLTKVANTTPAPFSAKAQTIAFPMDKVVARDLYCATCHQEHQGANFDLNKVSNEQCRSCHIVQFDSFDGNHPKFDNYPFKRRTRIIYDHAGHFGKHFPEIAQKDSSKRIPDTCSACHDSRIDKRIIAVTPFTETCATCHLDQITGKDRASGPKGIAFLSLPGLDLQTLNERNASIGEWPEESQAELTPFMKVMISRSERGRALIKTVGSLNLLDLSGANDDQIEAVARLAWEIKGLFYALISGKASDVLADLNLGGGVKLSANLVVDLTASIPRDVVISAHQEWLPNLGAEMANRPEVSEQQQTGWSAAVTESRLAGSVSPEELFGSNARQSGPSFSPQAAGHEASVSVEPLRLAQANQQVQSKNTPGIVAEKNWRIDSQGGFVKQDGNVTGTIQPKAVPSQEAPSDVAQPASTVGEANAAGAPPVGGSESASASIRPQNRAADQTDDLLFPTEEELRGLPGGSESARSEAPPSGGIDTSALPSPDAPANADAPVNPFAAEIEPQASTAPIITIESDVDPESWAEYGGWYRQDYAIFYRPTGHKDKFIYSWLFLTGPQAQAGEKSPSAAVFDALTAKDAQGSCTKCHSVDDIRSKGRLVNFSPAKVETKKGRFTTFIHEPHFGILEDRGCLTCHQLEKGRPYLKNYEHSNPQTFVSNFSEVKKDLCQTCHTSNVSRQDCLLCHKYHVNGVITPIMNTKIPIQ